MFACLGVNESVGCGVRVHLDIYVFNSDNITSSPPPTSQFLQRPAETHVDPDALGAAGPAGAPGQTPKSLKVLEVLIFADRRINPPE